MNEINNSVKLLAKVAIFFAKVDGVFHHDERKTINEFLTRMSEKYSENVSESELLAMENQTYSFEDIVSDTTCLIKEFSSEEKTMFLDKLDEFIEAVIKADGVLDPKEVTQFEEWKKQREYFLK